MHENPEGTPNPLNPTPSVGGEPQPTQPVAPVQTVQETVVMASETVEQPVATQPAAEPAGSIVEPPKKKKTGLIVAIIAFIVVALGCAGVAIAMLNPFGKGTDDRVPKAIAALFAEGAPTNVAMDGTVSLYNSDEDSDIMSLDLKFKNQINNTTLANSAQAAITVTFADGTDLTFNADEIHTEDGDLYLKLSGIPEAVENYRATTVEDCDAEEEDCTVVTTDTVETYFTILESLGIIDVIDDEWILIPSSNFSNVTELTDVDPTAQCLIDAAGTLGEYGSDFAKNYENNPFITYSTEELKVTKKKDNLYRLSVDTEKFAGFINAIGNSGFMNELNACMGNTATNGNVAAGDLAEMVNSLPVIYVEINENNQFTRVYLKAAAEGSTWTAEADISLSYPEKITITEPNNYIDISTVLSKVLDFFYSGIVVEDATAVETVTE